MSKSMITLKEEEKFFLLVDRLKSKRENIFLQSEIAKHIGISTRKIRDFEKGRIFDFWLLCRYADLVGESILFWVSGTLE